MLWASFIDDCRLNSYSWYDYWYEENQENILGTKYILFNNRYDLT